MNDGHHLSTALNLPIKNTLKGFLRFGLLILMTAPFQYCEIEFPPVIDESGYYYSKPLDHTAVFLLTFNEENYEVQVTVYSGIIDNNNVVIEKNFYNGSQAKLKLQTEKYYTLVARYKKNGRTYLVINSLEMKIEESYENDKKTCYYVQNMAVDLRLKN